MIAISYICNSMNYFADGPNSQVNYVGISLKLSIIFFSFRNQHNCNLSICNMYFADRPNAPNTAEPLSWGTRLIIMIGVARGLTYLHSSQNQVMCREVKASNILLDKVLTLYVYDLMLVIKPL